MCRLMQEDCRRKQSVGKMEEKGHTGLLGLWKEKETEKDSNREGKQLQLSKSRDVQQVYRNWP